MENLVACDAWDCDAVISVPEGKQHDPTTMEARGWSFGLIPALGCNGHLCPAHLTAPPLQILIG